jgi:hypothetical protein
MDLHRIEQQLSKVARRGGEDARLAELLRGEVGDFMRNASSFDQIGGNSAAARAALERSNRDYTKFYKDTAVQDAIETAAERAAKTASGGNRENTLRQEIDKLIKKRGDWTPDETEALKRVVFGAPGQNVTRLVGKLSPEGNGLAMMMHMMAAPFAGSWTLPMGALGFGAKRISEAQTRGHVADLSKIIRAGGSKANAFAQPNKVQKALKKARPTVAGLLGTGGELY